ncbi:MAG: efflux RND transporter permease subunit [Rhodospirillaceae bacterium]
MTLIDAAISRSRTVFATLALILIAGTIAYISIPKEAEPDVNMPVIYVKLKLEGISPEDAERLLIRPMELELRKIQGVKEMRASGFEGGANITLEYEAGFNADLALNDVRAKVDLAKSELPDEAEEPTVHEVSFAMFPVIQVTLSGPVPERELLKRARDLRDSIESITSVLSADIAGDREEMVEILVDPVKVESYGISPADAITIIERSNLLVAAGAQDTGKGRFSIKVPGLLENAWDILELPIKVDGDSVVRVGDIAEVRRTYKDRESFARVNGETAIALEVAKRSGYNIIEAIESVRKVITQERASWPKTLKENIRISYSQDKSKQVRTMLLDLQNNVMAAILLVMIVVIAALGVRTAGLVGLAIPGSFLTGILVISAAGLTVNIVVLFALILAVGMLVDGAIVVTEYADRKMIEGEPRIKAYALASKRMAWPIIASTATTLAAFLPLMFWPGLVGEFMKYLPITLVATLSASLMMALVFVPTLGAYIGKPGVADAQTMRNLAGGEKGRIEDISGGTGQYIRVLNKALDHPFKVLMAAVFLLVGVQVVYANFGKGIEFFPKVEPEFAKLQVRARGNLSAYEKNALMREVEKRILDMREFQTIYTRIGQAEVSQDSEDIIGTITLEFVDWKKRRKAREILAEAVERTKDLAGIHVNSRKQEAGPPIGKPVQIELSSKFPDILPPAIDKFRQKLESIDGLINVEDDLPLPGIDWQLKVDRAQAAKFGADIDLIGKAVQMVSTGIKMSEYRPDDSDDEVELRARYPRRYRTISELDNIRISTNEGLVPISNFVKRIAKQRTGTVRRSDSKRVFSVKADVAEGVLVDDMVKIIRAWLPTANFDPRIRVVFKGEDEEQNKAKAFLGKAFGIALFIMAIILVTQFNSFYSAFLILTAVVMSTIGVFIGLLVTSQPFGIVMGGIGVIALAGIVVNNNIVLIDTFDRLKQTTGSIREAILRTGAQRLRPVMLTTITTILGLMPMVLSVNIDFISREVSVGAPAMQWWSQLSTAIVFGLGFATVLTLVVTPSALMVRANVRAWLDKRRVKTLPTADRGAQV